MSKWAHENALKQPKTAGKYSVCFQIGCYGYVAKNSNGKEWMSLGEAKRLQISLEGASTIRKFGDE